MKLAGGIAPQRRVPGFAPDNVHRAGSANRTPQNVGNEQVMIWPDTFNDHFHPKTAQAAVEVLESAGYHVIIPDQWLCCGRPFYDFGMLDLAEKHLRDIMVALRPQIENGTPIVVLEPSCASVFRDDMRNLLSHEPDARRLYHQVFLLSEFIEDNSQQFDLPKLNRKALIQAHCHHKSVLKMDAELSVLRKLGIDFDLLNSGCCGMAGAFGFEKGDHYDVSIKAGERVLLPAVRDADDETLIIADGFSCREQIAQDTDRRALHMSEVIKMAMDQGPDGPTGGKPEEGHAEEYGAPEHSLLALAGAAGMALGAGVIGWTIKNRRSV